MEHTFMTIHNLTPDCNILFASESISDILGWRVEHIRGRAVFDFFHPDEVPFARSIHSRGILLDKAASLHYVRVLSVEGRWVSCECCFTVVHDVLVACTSIYRRGERSERRAIEGAQVRRIFSSSPRDPRYHMLEHLSPKFKMPPVEREPRAALILNRFTRNLTIMFATNAVASVLGLSPDQIKDKSFYRCIQERCLPDALNCLESAKANDSIAYLRFWSRDPREEADFDDGHQEDGDIEMPDRDIRRGSTSDSDDGGAALHPQMDGSARQGHSPQIKTEEEDTNIDSLPSASDGNSGQGSSANASSSRIGNHSAYETPLTQRSHDPADIEAQMNLVAPNRRYRRQPLPSVELEAVVSCTSDGLVVILRRARPAIPPAHPPLALSPWEFENGLFAAPWAQQPVRPQIPPEMLYTFRAPLLPQFMPLRENVKAAGGPPIDHLMRSIRDVAVFAWALIGINGNLAAYSHGRPSGEAAPPEGLPIWDPSAVNSVYQPPENQAAAKWAAFENSSDKGKGPAVQQPLSPDTYYTSARPSTSSRYNDYSHGSTGHAVGQQIHYNPTGHGYLQQQQQPPPPPPQQQQEPRASLAPSTNPPFPSEPWRDEQETRAADTLPPFAIPTSQPPGQSDLPHKFDGGLQ